MCGRTYGWIGLRKKRSIDRKRGGEKDGVKDRAMVAKRRVRVQRLRFLPSATAVDSGHTEN